MTPRKPPTKPNESLFVIRWRQAILDATVKQKREWAYPNEVAYVLERLAAAELLLKEHMSADEMEKAIAEKLTE